MKGPTISARSNKHFIDLAPLKQSPAFARLWFGYAVAGIGNQMTIVAVGLHIYDITRSTFAVAMVGGVALVPMILAGLYGGMLADRFDRRTVALAAATVAWLSTAAIAALAWLGTPVLWPLYVLTAINTVAAIIIGTARMAIIPRLLPATLLPAASALTGISNGLMITIGPALAGVLIALVGVPITYTIDVVLFTAAFAGLITLPRIRPEGDTRRPGLRSFVEGFRFLRRAPNIRAGYAADIAAMTFGRPYALLPAVGAIVLGGGAITVGVLTASFAVGTFVSSLLSGQVGTIRRHGVAIGNAVAAYGASILAFGIVLLVFSGGSVSEDIGDANWVGIALAFITLMAAGASDNVSSIFRTTMLQVAVPDNVRGRMNGIFTIVVNGGPRLGDIYVGIATVGAAVWFPPLLGGVLIIVLVGTLMRVSPGFRAYDALDPRP